MGKAARDESAVGLGVMLESEYSDARNLMGKSERLPEHYAEYIARLAQTETELTRAGYSVTRVPVELLALERFCRQRRLRMDRLARHLYVQHVMARQCTDDTAGT